MSGGRRESNVDPTLGGIGGVKVLEGDGDDRVDDGRMMAWIMFLRGAYQPHGKTTTAARKSDQTHRTAQFASMFQNQPQGKATTGARAPGKTKRVMA